MKNNSQKDKKNTINWNAKSIRRNSYNIAFKKGFRPWLSLVFVSFMFSLFGSADTIATSFIHVIDRFIGVSGTSVKDNTALLNEYLSGNHFTAILGNKYVSVLLNSIFDKYTWLINFLAANQAYFERNASEIATFLLITAVTSAFIRFFIQNVLIIGKNRYSMEYRYQEAPLIRRCFAPFKKKYIFNIIWVMLNYHIRLLLWKITIIGGIYKSYQYRMIPYIVAENPGISGKQAFRLSKEMTNGYKWKIFLLDVSVFYIEIIKLIPVAGLFIATPFQMVIDAEIYFALRKHKEELSEVSCFIEPAFDREKYYQKDSTNIIVSAYALPDIFYDRQASEHGIYNRNDDTRHFYTLTDYILMFFTFSCGGWLWEVGLHLIKHHTLVNRGTMNGPWLPIYGCGAVLCILLLSRKKRSVPRTFGLVVLVAGIMEFFTSWFLDFALNSHYWNYDDKFANINGRICFEGLAVFGLAGTMAIYVLGPWLSMKFSKMNRRWRNVLCILMCIFFAADLICCAIYGMNSGSGVGNVYK